MSKTYFETEKIIPKKYSYVYPAVITRTCLPIRTAVCRTFTQNNNDLYPYCGTAAHISADT